MTREKRIGVEVILPAAELTQTLVKVVLRPQVRTEAQGQLQLFAETGRTLTLDVVRTGAVRSSVLANGPKEVRLEPKPTGQTGEQAGEHSVTLFFQSSATFRKGEVLELEVRDVETGEAFPQGGSGLTVGRDM